MELILVLNSGSSNLKASLFEFGRDSPLWQTHVDWQDGPIGASIEKALIPVEKQQISAIGHRVVHGGETFTETILLDEKVKKGIEGLIFLAPLHNPLNLKGIEVCEHLFPDVMQFAVFDTAFHHTLDEKAFTYPIPWNYRKKGIRRYGFHGISFSYCTKRCEAFLRMSVEKLKIVICHLGAGSSLCAIKEGKSVDTTMGMTPIEGLMMATRSGSVDPGVLLYLLKNEIGSVDELEKQLNAESGLLGISGISGDIRLIEEAARRGDVRAKLALDLFIHRLRSCLGSMVASLGGVDVLIFTGGIGENSAWVRKEACAPFSFMGLRVDHEKNEATSKEEREISTTDTSVKVLVLPTNEELEIAQECMKKIKLSSSFSP